MYELIVKLIESNKEMISNQFDYLFIYIHAFILHHYPQELVIKNTFLYTNLLSFPKGITAITNSQVNKSDIGSDRILYGTHRNPIARNLTTLGSDPVEIICTRQDPTERD